MKKIFIICSKWCYQYIPRIQNRLKQLGYEVILPNFFDDPMIEEKIKSEMTKEEHIAFCKNSFEISQNKAKESDATLVLNFDKVVNDTIYINYIGGATFLEMYDAYLLNHPIFLYNGISEGMLHDEIEGMNPTIINGDLFKILEKDYFHFISEDNNLLKYFDEESLLDLKSYYDEYLKALVIIRQVFKNIKDKENHPYIHHLQRVSDNLDTPNQKVAGLLHDIVEDTDITCKDLLEVGFGIDIVRTVFIVTKEIVDKSEMSEEEKLALYDSEVDGIINSNIYDASFLKEKDIEDNYDQKRLELLPIETQEWFHKKYKKQLIKLKKVNEERKKLC